MTQRTTTQVRNGPLVRYQAVAAGSNVLATVPAGFTWLLKSIHVLSGTASPNDVSLSAYDGVTNTTGWIAALNIPAGGGASWNGWFAMGPGHELHVGTTAGPTHVWISGAELPGAIAPTS